ncbi:MAG: PIN domain-containing protein [Deltaproteobacteria bacterium]|nr:PIN domain-containing protein [Deltaproteobacteria bacterium]
MPKDNFVLIDTSVWIDYFLRRDSELEQKVDSLLDSAQIAMTAVVQAELIQGSRSEKEVQKLKEYFKPLFWIQGNDTHWLKAGEMSLKLRQTGKTINLTDCYIAVLAQSASASVFSLDKHFVWIAKIGGCSLFESNA